MLTIPKALDVVVASLALNRSITAPAEWVRHGPLWILRDIAPKPGKKCIPRLEEAFAFGAPPREVVQALKDYGPKGRFTLDPLFAASETEEAIADAKREYKSLGFRHGLSEPLFVCPLAGYKRMQSEWQIRRVTTMEEATRVTVEVFGVKHRKLRPEDLSSARPAMRYYYVEVGGRAVAAARSLMALPKKTWMHDVKTRDEYRRRGIASALMNHILLEDAKLGAQYSVLLASTLGAKLYPKVGYQQIGLLHIYQPVKRK
jgi:GNAT superfamily N-acetyltransferase